MPNGGRWKVADARDSAGAVGGGVAPPSAVVHCAGCADAAY